MASADAIRARQAAAPPYPVEEPMKGELTKAQRRAEQDTTEAERAPCGFCGRRYVEQPVAACDATTAGQCRRRQIRSE